jgi:hypothetical protein
MPRESKLGLPAALALVAAIASTASAEDKSGKGTTGAAAKEQTVKAQTDGAQYEEVDVLGMKVFIDKATGKMRPPTAAEAAQLQKGMRQLIARAQKRSALSSARAMGAPRRRAASGKLSNGTVIRRLDPSLYQFSTVTLRPDGTLDAHCAKGEDPSGLVPSSAPAGPEKE